MKVMQKIKSFFKRRRVKVKSEPKPEAQPVEKKSGEAQAGDYHQCY